MKIGHKTISQCIDQLAWMLTAHQMEMNTAYIKGGETLTVALSLKISPSNKGNKIVTAIKFTMDQCEDKGTSYVDEDQLSFLGEAAAEEVEYILPGFRFGRPGQGLYRGIY